MASSPLIKKQINLHVFLASEISMGTVYFLKFSDPIGNICMSNNIIMKQKLLL